MAAAAILLLLVAPAAAEDTVYLAGSGSGQTKITGLVLDYTGRELSFQYPDGQQQSFPAEKVIRVETQLGPQQTEADGMYAQGQFERALAVYAKALEGEPRRWVRREIIARTVCCYSVLDRLDQAGEAFLLLIRDDPDTLQFDCIPLAWLPRQPPPGLELAARQWLARQEPAARLLGASHLLAGPERPAALGRLRELSAGADRRIAALAMAQTWRAEVPNATTEQIDGWGRLIEQMPEPLAAGPYFVLGLARSQRQQPEQAALALLRVAILYPKHRPLAAQSLVEAGRLLETLDQTQQALRLYRETIRTYPEQTRATAEAQSRLEDVAKGQQQARTQ